MCISFQLKVFKLHCSFALDINFVLILGIYTPVARYHDWIMTNAERVGPSQYDPLYDCTSDTNLC